MKVLILLPIIVALIIFVPQTSYEHRSGGYLKSMKDVLTPVQLYQYKDHFPVKGKTRDRPYFC